MTDPTVEPEEDWESEGGAVLPPGWRITLRGPETAGREDLEAVLADLRAALPEGYRLESD